ncbi:AAA family ATPase [[Mycoplasma] testudinis]|uniref:AAA family ATPase n=1 Tax=[Mycoplasma] testudinis TaxID=33924 RepID=UPI000484748A|nr:AAA family ATPase [[Mycoplasma] testudinis]
MVKQPLVWTSKKSYINLSIKANQDLAKANPEFILKGHKPRLIDEWQIVPELWDTIRNQIDMDSAKGHYLLTGSSTPVDSSKIYHSGAGRFINLKMHPMSLFESLESKGIVSLNNLFEKAGQFKFFDENKEHQLENILFYMCRGGWPDFVLEKTGI